MDYKKLNLKCGDKVRIKNTSDNFLDNQICEIIGKSFCNVIDSYIILLEKPYKIKSVYDLEEFNHKAISLTEACLEKI